MTAQKLRRLDEFYTRRISKATHPGYDRLAADLLEPVPSLEDTQARCGSVSSPDTDDIIARRNREEDRGAMMGCSDHDGLS